MNRILLFAALLLAACATSLGTEIHRDETVSMAGMKTFRIVHDGFAVNEDAPSAGTLAARREIERAIQDTLVEKGYVQAADARSADFEVEYLVYTTERYQEGAHDRYVFDERVHVMSGAEPVLDNPVREGNLHIHLLKDGEPFYEGIATGVAESTIPVEKRIRSGVQRVLAEVPAAN